MRFVEEEKTEFGGQLLEPEILADGTKRFDLTASIIDWEVEPGKIVKAWAYNGMVPGPQMQVDVGDKVEIDLHTELPESTSIHMHGVLVPNAMDGVDPYTQAPIPPGESFTYAFTAREPAVGMYHSHHNAQVQVPNGLAGAFLIGEMPIPEQLIEKGFTAKADQQVTMVLNDAGTIGLTLNGKSFPRHTPPRSAKRCWCTTTTKASWPTRCTCTSQLAGSLRRTGCRLRSRCRQTRSTLHLVSVTRSFTSSPIRACGHGTATSSTTPKERRECSAWSPR
jgi:FtsP/CotA-like multicopper oxidase with cupredoxin domain